ncbi:MAG: hypothetical protein QMC36_07300 [Patescibacteria group bacterium]
MKRVVYLNIKPHHDSENRAVKKMFDGAGITLEAFDDLEVPDAEVIKDLLKVKAEKYS